MLIAGPNQFGNTAKILTDYYLKHKMNGSMQGQMRFENTAKISQTL